MNVYTSLPPTSSLVGPCSRPKANSLGTCRNSNTAVCRIRFFAFSGSFTPGSSTMMRSGCCRCMMGSATPYSFTRFSRMRSMLTRLSCVMPTSSARFSSSFGNRSFSSSTRTLPCRSTSSWEPARVRTMITSSWMTTSRFSVPIFSLGSSAAISPNSSVCSSSERGALSSGTRNSKTPSPCA